MNILVLEPDFEVVGQAASGEIAIDMLGCKSPDVVLLDLSMRGSAASGRCAASGRGRRACGGILRSDLHSGNGLGNLKQIGLAMHDHLDANKEHLEHHCTG